MTDNGELFHRYLWLAFGLRSGQAYAGRNERGQSRHEATEPFDGPPESESLVALLAVLFQKPHPLKDPHASTEFADVARRAADQARRAKLGPLGRAHEAVADLVRNHGIRSTALEPAMIDSLKHWDELDDEGRHAYWGAHDAEHG